ncbi:MAG: hypothetical protein ABI165_09265 [Bryobacteraceae bacterium]
MHPARICRIVKPGGRIVIIGKNIEREQRARLLARHCRRVSTRYNFVLGSATGAARTIVRDSNGFAPHSVLREFLGRRHPGRPVSGLDRGEVTHSEAMEDLSFDEFTNFIREWRKIPRCRSITPTTRLEADLGISGGDGIDVLIATEARFDISLSSNEHGFRETFNLRPHEFLFHSEGLGVDLAAIKTFFGGPRSNVIDLTAGGLHRAIQKALKHKTGSS